MLFAIKYLNNFLINKYIKMHGANFPGGSMRCSSIAAAGKIDRCQPSLNENDVKSDSGE